MITMLDIQPPNGVTFTLVGGQLGSMTAHAMRVMFDSSRHQEMIDWLLGVAAQLEESPAGTSMIIQPPSPLQVPQPEAQPVPIATSVNPSLHGSQQVSIPPPANLRITPPASPPTPAEDGPMPQMAPTVLPPPGAVPPTTPSPPPDHDTERPPALVRHDFGDGPYKIGLSVCKLCGVKATGYEKPHCHT